MLFSLLIPLLLVISVASNDLEESNHRRYKIEGRVAIPNIRDNDWIALTKVLVDGGEYLGFLRNDGSFTVTNVPSGSYIVEVTHPVYVFEPSRVDITSKGKMRARRLNLLNPSAVDTSSYPLKFKAKGRANYFQQREQWRITDFLYSPMVMMMVFPLVMMLVLPKLINSQDPEVQKEMQQSMNFLSPKQSMPEFSEMLTNLFSGPAPPKQNTKVTAKVKGPKKRQT